jgi:hypothetical protein
LATAWLEEMTRSALGKVKDSTAAGMSGSRCRQRRPPKERLCSQEVRMGCDSSFGETAPRRATSV